MKKSITLEDNEWGQIIDGLLCRAELYEETVRYHETGFADGAIAEVTDTEEARDLAAKYRSIIAKIEGQRKAGIYREQ